MKTVFGSAPEESDQHFKVCALRTDRVQIFCTKPVAQKNCEKRFQRLETLLIPVVRVRVSQAFFHSASLQDARKSIVFENM